MKIETVGSFLPNEELIDARRRYESGRIDDADLLKIENNAVKDIIERQIGCGLQYVTSGELRRKHWANDFWFGLGGIICDRVDSGRVYQSIESSTDNINITGRISYNPCHPVFDDFTFLFNSVGGRAKCRQTLPSPANMLLEAYRLSDGHPEKMYPTAELLVSDIAEAYRSTLLHLITLGCESIQYDDTACGLMCDGTFTKRLLQGGVDLLSLHRQIITVINESTIGVPEDIEKSIYLSGGDKVVPEWEHIEYPDNIMPRVLSTLNMDKFFLPFNLNDDYSLEILRHINKDKNVAMGLTDAHSPFSENETDIRYVLSIANKYISPEHLFLSPQTGFKLSSYAAKGLTYEDQWHKIGQLKSLLG